MPGKRNNRSNYGGLVFFILVIFQSLSLSAQDEIPDSLVTERIQCIQHMLDQGRTNTNRWWYGWLAGYSAATVGQGAVYFLSKEKGTRQDMLLGASTTFLGAAGQLIEPLNPGHDADVLSDISESTPADRLRKLSVAEEMLKKTAHREKQGRSWQTHALCSAVDLSSGLITWLGFKRSVWAGVENFALNAAITEAQIWTQPSQTRKNYRLYCNKYKSGINPVAYRSKLTWYVSVYPGGTVIKVMF